MNALSLRYYAPTYEESVNRTALQHAKEDGEFAAKCDAICAGNAPYVMPDDSRPQPIRTIEALARLALGELQ